MQKTKAFAKLYADFLQIVKLFANHIRLSFSFPERLRELFLSVLKE